VSDSLILEEPPAVPLWIITVLVFAAPGVLGAILTHVLGR